MKRMLLLPLALLAALVVAASAERTQDSPDHENRIHAEHDGRLVGDTVTWHNADSSTIRSSRTTARSRRPC